ncbi:MAG: SDR family oxidoreductase [Bacteroidetes bacterium]|nr:SDR family oxidoreductase [Bacteroidota bacterium]MBS1757713.1 SDR family oxidoreductase [Bacteroidota bacterium]
MNIVITGASRGIGKAIAEKFASQNAHLFLCSRNENDLIQTAAEIKNKYAGAEVKYFATDLAIKENVYAFANWCLAGAVPDVIINNAGQYIAGSITDEPEGALEKTIALNLYSAYYLCRKLLPPMIEKKEGHIFNICSVASLNAYPGGGSYSISKFALNGFSKNLRHELMPHGIKVTAVMPGAVLTDSWQGFDNTQNRIMEADDIASMIVAATGLSAQAVVEEIIIRPQLGDL